MMRSTCLALLIAAVSALPAHGQKPAGPPIQKPAIAVAAPSGAVLTTGQVSCSGQTASMPVSASFSYGAGNASKASVYIAVNGAATETFTVNFVKGPTSASTLSFSRTLSLPASRTDASLRIYVDGQPASQVQTVPYACYAVVAPTVRANARVTYGDVAIGPFAFAMNTPTRPLDICERRNAGVDGLTWENFWACGAPPPEAPLRRGASNSPAGNYAGHEGYGPAGIPNYAPLFRPDAPSRIQLSGCTAETDALVTVMFIIALKTDRIANPGEYAGEGFWELRYTGPAPRFTAGAGYWDYRIMQTAPDARNRTFPIGYEWVAFHRQLPCTRNGEMVYTFDAGNRLREDDETNNTIRIPFSTVVDN
ncbi:MAG TPA: hypothetical protein VIA80_02535 [Hyphomonadaceae bacterium]